MHAQHIISEVNTLFLSFKIHDCSWERMVSEKYTSTFTSGKRTTKGAVVVSVNLGRKESLKGSETIYKIKIILLQI